MTSDASPGLRPCSEPEITESLIAELDVSGPRYTSYPTADRFVSAFTEEHFRQALWSRLEGVGSASGSRALSVYVHIPFCESVCYYCACNKTVTRQHSRAAKYLDALEAEMDLQLRGSPRPPEVGQLHLGGGTPTFLSPEELARLMGALKARFEFQSDAELAIEVDPRTVNEARLEELIRLGFNRLSLGVQDFDARVQKAVHRVQDEAMVRRLMECARGLGLTSINLDLIYGLPQQTLQSLGETLEKVKSLRPDRIALYGYAHLPDRFKPQRRIDPSALPSPVEKIKMLALAIKRLSEAGYVYIGMDHFALPSDELATALRQGRLQRNFQGYSTHADTDSVGLGVSAISRIGAHYSQNHKDLETYEDAVNRGHLPIERGLCMTRDDLVRRAVIMALMCQGLVDFESIELAHLIDMKKYFKVEFERLRPLQARGLVEVTEEAIQVMPLGRYFVRAVAMVFDRYLQHDQTRARFSRIV